MLSLCIYKICFLHIRWKPSNKLDRDTLAILGSWESSTLLCVWLFSFIKPFRSREQCGRVKESGRIQTERKKKKTPKDEQNWNLKGGDGGETSTVFVPSSALNLWSVSWRQIQREDFPLCHRILSSGFPLFTKKLIYINLSLQNESRHSTLTTKVADRTLKNYFLFQRVLDIAISSIFLHLW